MTDNVRALAEKLYYIAKHAEFSEDGIAAIESLLWEAMEQVRAERDKNFVGIVQRASREGERKGRSAAFSEAAEIAEIYPGPGGYVDCDSFEPKDVMIAFAKGIAAKLRQKAAQ